LSGISRSAGSTREREGPRRQLRRRQLLRAGVAAAGALILPGKAPLDLQRPGLCETRTLWWREMGSKFQFRDASRHRQQRGRLHFGGEWCSLSPRNSSIGLPRPTTARIIPLRQRSIDRNPTEVLKPLPIWRGTEISNPFPSSGESHEICCCGFKRCSRCEATMSTGWDIWRAARS